MVRHLAIDIGIINCAFCLTEFDEGEIPAVIFCECIAFGRYKDGIDIILKGIHIKMQELHSVLSTADHVTIEQQVGNKSNKNFSIGCVIYYHFINMSKSVTFMNPKVKFNYVKSLDISAINELLTTEQANKKKLSVQIATVLADHYNLTIFKQTLVKYKKKDDVSDAMIMSLVH